MVDPTTGKLGALTPPSQAWAEGKTAGSVAFVNEGEKILFALQDPVKFMKLREKIDRVKDGRDVFLEYVEDWDAYVENL